MFVSHLYVFFGEMSVQFLAHFLIGSFIFLELSCRSYLYIFEIDSLSVASFAIIFSHSEGCLFTLLIVSFIVQKLFNLIRSHLFLFLFPLLWEMGHKGSCCDLCQRVFCLFSSKSFKFSGLTFRSLIHFEFVFVLESVLDSFFYMWLTSFTSTTC